MVNSPNHFLYILVPTVNFHNSFLKKRCAKLRVTFNLATAEITSHSELVASKLMRILSDCYGVVFKIRAPVFDSFWSLIIKAKTKSQNSVILIT